MNRWMAVFVILLAMPMAFAATNVTTDALAAAVAQAQCRVGFTTGVITTLTTNIPASAAAVSSQSSTLQADLTQLQGIQDPKAFRDYVQTHLEPDMKAAAAAIKTARQSEKNISKDVRQALQAAYKQLQQAQQTCEFQALQKFANLRVEMYTSHIALRNAQLTNLSGRGFDVSQMQTILSNAQSQIVTPLQNAINAANDTKSLHAALGQYCLWDGCKNGVNFHLEAQLSIAQLQMVLNKFKATPRGQNDSADVATAQQAIDAASSALSSVGTSVYTPQTHDQVWNSIKQATQSLRSILTRRITRAKPQSGSTNTTTPGNAGGAQ